MWTDHFWLVGVLLKVARSVFLSETNSGVASAGKIAIFLAQHNPQEKLFYLPSAVNFGF